MPLDEFQKGVSAIISQGRSPGSPFAGGAVIQQHGVRPRPDQDIFTVGEEPLDRLVQADRLALEAGGYTVQMRRSWPGFRECMVVKPMIGTTLLQWTAGLAREYYAPVPDPLFGHRLHFADLAVNKAIAAASRMRKRDFVDLWMLDRHVMPLWRMACAAPGKETDLNPFSLIERASLNWSMTIRRADPGDILTLTADISLEEIGAGLRNAMHEARLVLRDVDPECYGRLQTGASGQPLLSRAITAGGSWKAPGPGGAMPAVAGMDSEMIAGLIAEYGPEGRRYTGDAPPAARAEDDRTARRMGRGAPGGPVDGGGTMTTDLHEAARANDTAAIAELIAQGADVNARTGGYDNTPLHYAAAGSADTINTLIELGADPNARDRYRQTPLHIAAGYNPNPDAIMLLLEAGGDVEARDAYDHTPLHAAARAVNPAALVALVENGADPNAGDQLVYTPLHYAAIRTEARNITALTVAGADPEAGDRYGITPLDLARREENDAVIAALEAATGQAPASEPTEPDSDTPSTPSM